MCAETYTCPACATALEAASLPSLGAGITCPLCGMSLPLSGSRPSPRRKAFASSRALLEVLLVVLLMGGGALAWIFRGELFSVLFATGKQDPAGAHLPAPREPLEMGPVVMSAEQVPASGTGQRLFGTERLCVLDIQDPPKRLSFSRDGRYLAVRTSMGKLLIRDLRSGQVHDPFASLRTASFAFSPDGKTLATGLVKMGIVLWDLPSLRPRTRLPEQRTVTRLSYSSDSQVLAGIDSKGQGFVWDTRSASPPVHFQVGLEKSRRAPPLVLSPDGKLVAVGSPGQTVLLIDAASGAVRATLAGHTGMVKALAFAPDGRTLVSSAEDDADVHFWDPATGTRKGVIEDIEGALDFPTLKGQALAFSPAGKVLAVGTACGCIHLFDAETHELYGTLRPLLEGMGAIAFSPDGRALAALDYTGMNISLLDLDVTREKRTLTEIDPASYRALAPDGSRVAFVQRKSRDDLPKMVIIDVATGKKKTLAAGTEMLDAAAFAADGKTLFLAGTDPHVRLWDTEADRECGALNTHSNEKKTLLSSKDGKTLAVALSTTIQIWDVSKKQLRGTLEGHQGRITSLAFSADARVLVSSSTDRTARVWDLGSLKQRHAFDSFQGKNACGLVALSADGKLLAATSESEEDRTIRLWDAASGEELQTLPGHRKAVTGLAFTSDGQTLLSAGVDAKLRRWDVDSGHEQACFGEAPGGRIVMAADGRTFALVGGKQTKLWDTASVFEPLNAGRPDVYRSVPMTRP